MKICAIICEYNPLHNGHVKHIGDSREKTGCDTVLCLMSGNFVQRGEPAMLDKFTRAELAIRGGADIVLELPAIYATSTAEKFAYGAVKILNAVPEITHLSFGSESGELGPISELAEFLTHETPAFKKLIQEQLAKGNTLASAKTSALLSLVNSGSVRLGPPEQIVELLSSSNTILGLEYLKALYASSSKILPFTVKREGSSYNNKELEGEFSSASAIRNALNSNCPEDAAASLPAFVYERIKKRIASNRISPETYSDMMMYKLRTMDTEEIKALYDVGEGLENRIKTYSNFATGSASLIDAVKTKRYTHARLRRILLYALLGVTAKTVQRTLKAEPYAKVLAVKDGRQDILSCLKTSKLHTILRREDYKPLLTGPNDLSVKTDLLATDIYALLNSDATLKMGGQDYSTGLITVSGGTNA